MTFETWWKNNHHRVDGWWEEEFAQSAWDAATLAERERCAFMVESFRASSNISYLEANTYIAKYIRQGSEELVP